MCGRGVLGIRKGNFAGKNSMLPPNKNLFLNAMIKKAPRTGTQYPVKALGDLKTSKQLTLHLRQLFNHWI